MFIRSKTINHWFHLDRDWRARQANFGSVIHYALQPYQILMFPLFKTSEIATTLIAEYSSFHRGGTR